MSAPGQILAPYQAFLDLSEKVARLRSVRAYQKPNITIGTSLDVAAVLDAFDAFDRVVRRPEPRMASPESTKGSDLDGWFRLRRDPPRPNGARYFDPFAGSLDEPSGLFRWAQDAEACRSRLPDADAWQVLTRAECARLDREAATAPAAP